MEVSTINSACCNYVKYSQYSQKRTIAPSTANIMTDKYVYQPTFGIANSAGLRNLFEEGLTSIYSGKEMIPPRKAQKMLKNTNFNLPAIDTIGNITKYKKSMYGKEKKVYHLLKIHAPMMQGKNLKEIMQKLSPFFEKILIPKELVVFKELSYQTKELPEDLKDEYTILMQNTMNKIHRVPVLEKFSSDEFTYKLSKFQEVVNKLDNKKANRVMALLLEQCKNFSEKTTPDTIENQKKTLSFIETIIKTSCLKDNDELQALMQTSWDKLNQKPTLVPFSRKVFIYDFAKVVNKIPDQNMQTSLMKTACKLPSSSNSLSAYIVKIAQESPDKIAYRLLWPFFASVEHLLPRSCGGKDEMANFAGATTLENSTRQSIPFAEQMRRIPKTGKYCQKNVDRLIKYAHNGVFEKCRVNPKYIEDHKNTIYRLSEGKIKLDISKL